jgi:hypothetical protein
VKEKKNVEPKYGMFAVEKMEQYVTGAFIRMPDWRMIIQNQFGALQKKYFTPDI